MSEDTSEKKHKPSPKRLQEFRKEGKFLRAKEFYSGVSLIAALISLYLLSGRFYEIFARNFVLIYSGLDHLIHQPQTSRDLIGTLARDNLLGLFPLFFISLLFFFVCFSAGRFTIFQEINGV